MNRFIYTVMVFLMFFLGGCSLFKGVQTQRKEIPVEEVPVQARQGDDLRKRVIVLPVLDNELQRSQNITDMARRVIVEELMATRQFIVIDNADIPQDLGTFVKDKEYDMIGLSRLAANIGVSAVIEGKILDVKARKMGDSIGVFRKLKATVDADIQTRAYGAKSGREIFNSVRRATVETETTRVAESTYSDSRLAEDPTLVREAVRKAFRETVGGVVKAVEKLSWEGRIALVRGDRVYVNAGRLSGIQVGDVLKISEDGEEVFDPETGSFLGLAPGRMKGTVEIVNYYGKDGAVGIIHSGSGFKENDRVELY